MTVNIALAEWERNEVVLALRGRAKVRRGLADGLLVEHPEWKGEDTLAGLLLAQADKIAALALRLAEAEDD